MLITIDFYMNKKADKYLAIASYNGNIASYKNSYKAVTGKEAFTELCATLKRFDFSVKFSDYDENILSCLPVEYDNYFSVFEFENGFKCGRIEIDFSDLM